MQKQLALRQGAIYALAFWALSTPSSLVASMMLPFTLSLPDMKAFWPLSLPSARSAKAVVSPGISSNTYCRRRG